MKDSELTEAQADRVSAFKQEFAELLARHNVQLEIFESRYAHVDGDCQKEFVFMVSDPTKYDGEPFSDVRISIDEFESLNEKPLA